MKNTVLDPVVSVVIRSALYCLLALGTAFVLLKEASSIGQSATFNESSMIEWLQLLYLCICVILFFLSMNMKSSRMPLSMLLAGMALLASIRELDYYLDNYVFDGAWQTIALLVALVTGFYVIKYSKGLKSSIQEFTTKASFGYMTSAFVILFVFSRMIGMQLLWRAVMGENYMRTVKSLVEESTELFGYTLLLIGAIEFYRESRSE